MQRMRPEIEMHNHFGECSIIRVTRMMFAPSSVEIMQKLYVACSVAIRVRNCGACLGTSRPDFKISFEPTAHEVRLLGYVGKEASAPRPRVWRKHRWVNVPPSRRVVSFEQMLGIISRETLPVSRPLHHLGSGGICAKVSYWLTQTLRKNSSSAPWSVITMESSNWSNAVSPWTLARCAR